MTNVEHGIVIRVGAARRNADHEQHPAQLHRGLRALKFSTI
jgi:hypothetical protein